MAQPDTPIPEFPDIVRERYGEPTEVTPVEVQIQAGEEQPLQQALQLAFMPAATGGTQLPVAIPMPELTGVPQPMKLDVSTAEMVQAELGVFWRMPNPQLEQFAVRLKKLGYLGKPPYTRGEVLRALWAAANDAALTGTTLSKVLLEADTGEVLGSSLLAEAAAEESQQRYLSMLESVYLRVWGVPPPPGYLEAVAQQGINVYEFELMERQKPAYKLTPQYQLERLNVMFDLARRLGGIR